MMVDLQKINTVLFIYLTYFFIFLSSNSALSNENKIIFKINNIAYTSIDLEIRKGYLDFVGNNIDLNDDIILKDFISANLFYEFYKNSNNNRNYDKQIKDIYENIDKLNKKNKKNILYKLSKENILKNLKIDFIRKTILENIVNSELKNFDFTKNEIDLLYNFNLKYISLNNNDFLKIEEQINDLKSNHLNQILTILQNNEIKYFIKEKEIIDINKIDKTIKNHIIKNNNFFILRNNNNTSLIFIEKKFETFESIIANIYSVKSKDKINNNFLLCKNLSNFSSDENIIIMNKEYKFSDLNNKLKDNLIDINDYIEIQENGENIYIVLCNIKFDKKVLDNFGLNKLINLNVTEIETKFIQKYSKKYNLINNV